MRLFSQKWLKKRMDIAKRLLTAEAQSTQSFAESSQLSSAVLRALCASAVKAFSKVKASADTRQGQTSQNAFHRESGLGYNPQTVCADQSGEMRCHSAPFDG
jgi:hypothetical protein